MAIRVPAAGLGTPPEKYDRDYMLSLVRSLEMALRQARAPDITAATVTVVAMPQSGYGLQPGALWQDSAGVVHVVRTGDAYLRHLNVQIAHGRMGAI